MKKILLTLIMIAVGYGITITSNGSTNCKSAQSKKPLIENNKKATVVLSESDDNDFHPLIFICIPFK